MVTRDISSLFGFEYTTKLSSEVNFKKISGEEKEKKKFMVDQTGFVFFSF